MVVNREDNLPMASGGKILKISVVIPSGPGALPSLRRLMLRRISYGLIICVGSAGM